MRCFEKILFLGNGEYSMKNLFKLQERFNEGIHVSGALQQPDHATTQEEAEFQKQQRIEMHKDLEDIVKDIITALLGEKFTLSLYIPLPKVEVINESQTHN